MKNILLAVFVCFFAWKVYDTMQPVTLPDHLAFSDPSGTTHQLDSAPSEPYVIMPWIDNCPYSARSLEAIEHHAQSGAINGRRTIALYLNPITDDKLRNHDSVKHSSLTHAAAQKDMIMLRDFHEALLQDSGYMPGDFFIVGTNGAVEHIKAREFTQAEFEPKMSEALKL